MGTLSNQDLKEIIDQKEKEITEKVGSRDTKQLGFSFKCAACKTGILTGGTALIIAAIAGFPEDTPILVELAELVGLDEDIVYEIIKEIVESGGDVLDVAEKLCHALGACD